jgi:putative endonuclease
MELGCLGGWVYILTNLKCGVLYIGVTNDLERRLWEHRSDAIAGFTKRYNCHRLVMSERYERIDEAIAREKQLKAWRRAWKIELIEQTNPDWNDLGA